ncbi:MAG: GNAT family N-acetyltransferase [Actinomycetota bacterium]|nr:GNAT family N-acetyltransferase [Actinomycetota bacterium]
MMPRTSPFFLSGRRILLRPLGPADWEAWREVRKRCHEWLVKWEPRAVPGHPDPTDDRRAFVARCGARDRERELGSGFGFGVFAEGRFCGEINLNSIQRGPFQNAYIGYWMDQAAAGNGYTPEAVAVVLQFAFEELGLHRVQISIIPRNRASRRVVEKLAIRDEGVALRYLEINGVWEDHIRFAITAEEWVERRNELLREWVLTEAS